MTRKAKPAACDMWEPCMESGPCPCTTPCDQDEQVTDSVPTHGDAIAVLTNLTETAGHPDTRLFALLERAANLHDQIETAQQGATEVYREAMAAALREAVDLSSQIAATPALTLEGLHAKAFYALGDRGPGQPLDTTSINAPAFSALRDFLMMGRA